ncbi:MAG: hypothetical protein IPN49_10365 [Saprospiraceae bacterium]|nr:hypothetical protein [Saprospiraceae bacterium]
MYTQSIEDETEFFVFRNKKISIEAFTKNILYNSNWLREITAPSSL